MKKFVDKNILTLIKARGELNNLTGHLNNDRINSPLYSVFCVVFLDVFGDGSAVGYTKNAYNK
ncbi:MAG: hypothetical protein FWC97_06360 [Treponema sp.]|nr:hypothetical protein [Treponema sp.]